MTSPIDHERARPGVLGGIAQRHGGRSAEKNAGFFIQHLKQGMRVVDVGCGPGTITLGFADRVAPGEVTGIDLDAEQVERAVEHAVPCAGQR